MNIIREETMFIFAFNTERSWKSSKKRLDKIFL